MSANAPHIAELAEQPPDERKYYEQVRRDLPRNFAANLVHGMLGVTGFRLVTAPTFVPAYIYLLSGSKMAVGLALCAQYLGMALSSIWGATLIEHRRRVMRVVYNVGWLMRAQVLGLAVSAYLLSGYWALVAACIFLALFGFFNGMQSVTFSFLMSKVIPVERRGQLTGMRNFLGGLIASGVAYLGGRYLVESNVFGNGYATTFLVAFVLTSIGISALTFVREPDSLMVNQQSDLWERLMQVPAILRSDAHYTRFFIARTLAALGATALPFYALYAGKSINLSGAILGYLSLAFLLSQTVSNLAWGGIADRYGYRLVFLVSMVLWTVSTIGLMFAGSLIFIMVAFCGLGAGFGGYFVASQNFVLEFGALHERPMLIAVSDTASHLMMAIGPLLGGMVAQGFDFIYVFWLAVAVKALSIVAILRVEEPRYRLQRVHTEDD
ncbi:MFS transporter [Noviherbaspirillum sp.]|jgi:MFS family permease|uniref:MFS transporter n=1 Tax=Noviherbaspirillum sp. TaxID=1926288 RepID=UPI0025FFC293|nr:MFS transporter [Noviherbaspirillum sp.]